MNSLLDLNNTSVIYNFSLDSKKHPQPYEGLGMLLFKYLPFRYIKTGEAEQPSQRFQSYRRRDTVRQDRIRQPDPG